jgi:lipopolysaccharide export system permease protein
MCILDRYIFKSTVKLFFGCLALFLSLYVIVDVFSRLDDILKNQASLYILTRYYASFFPAIFVQVAPIACLLSTLYTFAKLNRDNEIIAMRSAGLSILQITRTVIVFGALVTFFVFLVSDKIVPKLSSVTEKLKIQIETSREARKEAGQEAISDLSMYGLKNRLFFINKFSPQTNTMEGITVLEHDDRQNITKKIMAKKGVYKDEVWIFYQSYTFNFDKSAQVSGEPEFYEEEIMSIPESPRDFLTQRQRPEFMTIAQLDEYIWKLSRSGATGAVRNLLVDFYSRFTFPLTSIIIILLAIPFALMVKKRSTGMASIGLSIAVGFLYYVLNSVSLALGKAGIIMPILSAAAPHILAVALSLYFINSLP